MTLGQVILEGKNRLQHAQLECADPLLHMKQIAQAALDLSPTSLLARWDDPLGADSQSKIQVILNRRLLGEPFQYITGCEYFWESKFAVGPGVLIPRPETEHLVEIALKEEARTRVRVAELGAGSGAIGITLLLQRPQWKWFAWEKNPESVPYAKKNLALLPHPSQYMLQEGDYFVGAPLHAPYDWIIANPPYVPKGDIAGLSREVRQEPKAALDGGVTGLEIVEQMIAGAPKLLAPGGGLLLEIGHDQGPPVLKLLHGPGWVDARIDRDLAGRDRIAFAKRSI
jgi:release factor glutamine methyltransferase